MSAVVNPEVEVRVGRTPGLSTLRFLKSRSIWILCSRRVKTYPHCAQLGGYARFLSINFRHGQLLTEAPAATSQLHLPGRSGQSSLRP
jgi:hypothetical protein